MLTQVSNDSNKHFLIIIQTDIAKMSAQNKIIQINNDKYLLRKCPSKLVLHHLPSLDIVHKYYCQIDFFCINKLEIMIIFKNVLTFLKPKCVPLRLIQYQQDYLDWEPKGGLIMDSQLILYDKKTIGFYYRRPKLQKSWAIEVIQEIQSVQKSPNQSFLALKVKQPKNAIFIWDMANPSKKPNQQIHLSQSIIQWQFHGEQILCILNSCQLKLFFINKQTNSYFIQYHIPLCFIYKSFKFLSSINKTQLSTGRKSINTISFLQQNTNHIHIVQLYDIEKRKRKFQSGQIKEIQIINHKENHYFVNILCGYQDQQKFVFIAEKYHHSLRLPYSIIVDNKYNLVKINQYKQRHGTSLENIQAYANYVLFHEKNQKKYKLAQFQQEFSSKLYIGPSNKLKILKEYFNIQTAILSKNYVFVISSDKKCTIQQIKNYSQNKLNENITIDWGKYNPLLSYYLCQNSKYVFFVCGIRYFKYDILKKQLINIGFVLKNQRAKLIQVRKSTYSLLYKINNQFVLIDCVMSQLSDKLTFQTIKSSENQRLISLRNGKWAKLTLSDITYGEGQNQLAKFNMQKMYKSLLQDNCYFEYEVYWITHGGMALAVKNYLFFLQIIENQMGCQMHLIKKGHSYLHRRFSSNIAHQHINIIDTRSLIIYTGNRLLKLSSQINSFITENPYKLPDTLLNRQLEMRQYYAPHHPRKIIVMMENGWFDQVLALVKKINQWIKKGNNLQELYSIIHIEDYYFVKEHQQPTLQPSKDQQQINEQQVVVLSKQQRNDSNDVQLLRETCKKLLQTPQYSLLSANTPLVLQNVLQSLVFKCQNNRSLDYFSQSCISLSKLHINKSSAFTTMQVAFLIHSINKDQAIEFLKENQQKMEWGWFVKYSIVFWSDNVDKLRKYTEEIAINSFRNKKDPFDALFWYVLAGKKALLITLFKANKFITKQHDAMHTFLQRDFTDAKNKTAAIKNAYALIDKKRYMHAMAFFLLGDKIQQCIRFTINRLNDLNLAYLIHLLNSSNAKVQGEVGANLIAKEMIQKGDCWAKHIGWFMEKKHVASYNCLLTQNTSINWELTPKLQGFHPSIVQFSQKIKQSIQYKRQLQQKINQNTAVIGLSQDFDFNNFSQENIQKQTNQNSQQQMITKKVPQYYQQYQQLFQQMSQKDQSTLKDVLKKKSVNYFMKFHFPCLALAILVDSDQKYAYNMALRAYQLEKYILTGNLTNSVVQIADGLYDIIAILKKNIKQKNLQSFKDQIVDFTLRFQSIFRKVKINELNPPSKSQIGQILHYCYFSQKIMNQLVPLLQNALQNDSQISKLKKITILSKVVLSICLNVLTYLPKLLYNLKQSKFELQSQQFWVLYRQKYDLLSETKKQKHQKLMDSFQLSLNRHIKKQKQQNNFQSSIDLPKESVAKQLINRKILQFMISQDKYMINQISNLKIRLDKIGSYWIEKQFQTQVQFQLHTLVTQGIQYKLKLNILSDLFKNQQLDKIHSLCKLIFTKKYIKQVSQRKLMAQINGKQPSQNDQKIAIQVFKNKTDNFKSFVINKNDGNALQIVVLSKRGFKKFQLCDNLVNRDRTKDGVYLLRQDNLVNSHFYKLDLTQMLQKSQNIKLHTSLEQIISSRKLYDEQMLIKRSGKQSTHLLEYLKPIDPIPQIDYNEINCVQSHSYLPIFFVGGKGMIEVCSFQNMKNFNRIVCTGLDNIIKIQSVGQRIYSLDSVGNLFGFVFDHKYNIKPIFELKKQGITDFNCINCSQICMITANSMQVIDSLLHIKKQMLLKIQMTTSPISICCLSQCQIIVLRRTQIQIYDLSTDKLQETYQVGCRAKCLYVDREHKKIFVGRYDCKVKIIDFIQGKERIVSVGNVQDQKDKVYVTNIQQFGKVYLCHRSDGSIYFFHD